jgi:hypothetical protein
MFGVMRQIIQMVDYLDRSAVAIGDVATSAILTMLMGFLVILLAG